MMGSSTITSSTISEALSLINAVLDPQTAKQGLEQLRAETAKLQQARATALEEQKRAATATAEAEKATAAIAERTAALDQRERDIAVREERFETARAEIRRKVAGELT
jgi:hypothetical protein